MRGSGRFNRPFVSGAIGTSLADGERAYLERLRDSRRIGAPPFWQHELVNLLAITGMTPAEFIARRVTPALLEWLRPTSRWAAGSPSAWLRMTKTLTGTVAGKTKVFSSAPWQFYGIGTTIPAELAAEFIQDGNAAVSPALTLRVLCTQWPGGVGTVIPRERHPTMRNTNGVEVKFLGTLVEPQEQFYRGDTLVHCAPLPLKDRSDDYLDHLVRSALDVGAIEILSKGRLLSDPATLPPCPLPAPKTLPEPNLTDRRAQHFREMKAGPVHGYNSKTNQWFHMPA